MTKRVSVPCRLPWTRQFYATAHRSDGLRTRSAANIACSRYPILAGLVRTAGQHAHVSAAGGMHQPRVCTFLLATAPADSRTTGPLAASDFTRGDRHASDRPKNTRRSGAKRAARAEETKRVARVPAGDSLPLGLCRSSLVCAPRGSERRDEIARAEGSSERNRGAKEEGRRPKVRDSSPDRGRPPARLRFSFPLRKLPSLTPPASSSSLVLASSP